MKIQKIKTTLLIFSGLIILSFAFFSIAEENSTSNKNIFQDSDGDGLTNEEEKAYETNPSNPDTDGDGYSDGVEISSGYDPLKHSPGDKIVKDDAIENTAKVAGTSVEKNVSTDTSNADSKNLTNELSGKVTDLITQSQAENKEIDIADLDGIIDQTVGAELTFADLPEIDESTIKIKEQDYSKLSESDRKTKEKEDATQYLTAIGYIMATNSPQSIQTEDDIQKTYSTLSENINSFSNNTSSIPEYFITLSEKGELMLEQIKNVEVPESMVDYHIKGMQLASYAISLKEEATKETDDPIAMFCSISKAGNILSLTESFVSEILDKLTSLGISNITSS